MNFLNSDDRQGKIAELKHTIEGLALVDTVICSTPMIITDHGGEIHDEGPYYMEDRQVGFKRKLKPGQTFFVILNHFDESGKVSESHMIAGYLRPNGSEFELFDPNGKMHGEGIYRYFTDVYETVARFLPEHRRVEYYTGSSVICPLRIKNPCIFRSIVFVLFRSHLNSLSDTIRVIRTLIRNPDVVKVLLKVVEQINKTQKQGILSQHINEVTTEFAKMMSFGYQFKGASPVSVSTRRNPCPS